MRILMYNNVDEYIEGEFKNADVDVIHTIWAYGFPALEVGDIWNEKFVILGIFQHDASDCYWIVYDIGGTLVEEDITEWYHNHMDEMLPF